MQVNSDSHHDQQLYDMKDCNSQPAMVTAAANATSTYRMYAPHNNTCTNNKGQPSNAIIKSHHQKLLILTISSHTLLK